MAVETNILDGYRSVTYNFILAAASPDMLKDPNQAWRQSPLQYVIASTKGKGTGAITSNSSNADTTSLVQTFNSSSPGAFDLWIDNVEIDTIMAPNEQTGPALGTKVAFEVYEPYSVNGFIEALHVAAQSAGWSGYLNATFILKIEFVGYPDSDTTPTNQSKIINEKFIAMLITGSDIEVTEQGTRYKVKAVPINEIAYSNFNKLTAARQMTGATVGEVFDNLSKSLNDGIKDRAQKEKSGATVFDTYEIKFPQRPGDGASIDIESKNEISKSKINDTLKENNVYQFQDLKDKQSNPNGTDPNNKYDPKNSIVQFPANSDIIDIITAVIRDSQYLKNTLENIKKEVKDGDGMIDYFQVIVNAIPTDYDTVNNTHCYKYQYLVVPYKVHTSQLPDQQYNKFNPTQFDPLVKRSYDYLYAGQNVDVLNFKLNFNNLYFQASNANQGNKPVTELSNAAAPSDNPNVKKPKDQAKGSDKAETETSKNLVINEASSNLGRAGATRDDPYWQLAYNAHQAILESVNLVQADIEIMGDPYYLCTSGMGNYLPKTKDIATTTDGEANFTSAPVVVRFNFKNPIDIDSTTGFLKFAGLAPFSGLYRVIKCVSKFNDGLFKQSLKAIRYAGQLAANDPTPTTTSPPADTSSDPKNAYVKDSAPADIKAAGVSPNTVNLMKMLGKSVPSNGLPGSLNTLMASGSYIPGLSDFLTGQTAGGGAADVAAAASGLLGNAAGVFGGGGLSSLTGLAGKASSLLSNPLGAVGNLANGAVSGVGSLISNPSSLLSQTPGISQGLNVLNQASGGLGLNVGSSLSGLNPLTAGVRVDASAIGNVVDQIKNAGSSIVDASSNMIANVTSVGGTILGADQASAAVSDALSNGISSELGLKNASTFGLKLPNVSGLTPDALTSKLGLDPSQLSGLGGNLGSQLASQIKSLSEVVPENVSLDSAKKLGISLDTLDQVSLKNLPALPPLNVKAPDVEKSAVDALVENPRDPKILAQFGMTSAMGALKSNIGGSLPNLDNLKSGLTGAIPSVGSLVADAQAGFGSSITSQLGSLSGGSPLDKLNIPSVDSLTAQASNLTSSLSSNLGIG